MVRDHQGDPIQFMYSQLRRVSEEELQALLWQCEHEDRAPATGPVMRAVNPGDERLRALERAAAQGDPQAQAALEHARRRVEDVVTRHAYEVLDSLTQARGQIPRSVLAGFLGGVAYGSVPTSGSAPAAIFGSKPQRPQMYRDVVIAYWGDNAPPGAFPGYDGEPLIHVERREVWHDYNYPLFQRPAFMPALAVNTGQMPPPELVFAVPRSVVQRWATERTDPHVRMNPDEQGDLFALGGADRRRQAEADEHLRQLDHLAKFADAMRPDPREWEFQEPVIDTGQRDGAKCVCGHPIRYVYQVVRARDGKKIGVGSVCIESSVPYLLQSGADGLALALQRALERQEGLAKELAKKARAAKGDEQVQALTADWLALQAFMRQQWQAYETKARKDADYYFTPNWRRFMPDWLAESHFGSFPKQQPKIMSSPGRTAASMRTKMAVPWWYALMSPVGGMVPLPTEPKLRQEVRASLERAIAFEREQQEKAAAGNLHGWEPQPDLARLKRAEYALSRF